MVSIMILVLIMMMGCSQEKSQPVQTQDKQQVQQQTTAPAPPTSQEFTFRGIKMGATPESQFPFCTEGMKGVCFKKNTSNNDTSKEQKEWNERHGHIENLPDLGVGGWNRSQELEIGKKIDQLEIDFNNGKIETLVIMMKQKFGDPSSVVGGVNTDIYGKKCETVTMKWNYQGYDITLQGADPRCQSSGEIIIKSPEVAKAEEAKKGKL